MILAKMLVRTQTEVPDSLINTVGHALADAFGHERFERGVTALERVGAFSHQGPAILGEPHETLIATRLSMQYYDRGYEEGDLPTIIAIADFLERNIPGGSVWYGGDASGYGVRPLTRGRRESLASAFMSLDRSQELGDPAPADHWPVDHVYLMPMRVEWKTKGSIGFRSRATGEVAVYRDGGWVRSDWPDR